MPGTQFQEIPALNITVVRRKCGFSLGGAEGYCANVASGLFKRGHKVTVVADESTLEAVPFERARVAGRGSLMKNLGFFMETQKVLERSAPSCVYGLSRIRNAGFLRISDPLHAAWLDLGYRSAPAFRFLRRLSLRHGLLLWQEREAIRTCGYIVTNSNLVKEQLAQYYQVKPEYVFTVYNGVDHQRFRPLSQQERQAMRENLGIQGGETALLFAGSDIRRKGLLSLLEAVGKLKYPVKLLIAGTDETSEAAALCRRLGISGQVTWLGFRMDMERLYQAADLFCLPTLYDPFANSVLEAISCGTPALTTRLNGASEVVLPLSPELVVPTPEPAELSMAMEFFLDLSSTEKTHLKERLLERSMGFTWDRHLDQLEELFKTYCFSC